MMEWAYLNGEYVPLSEAKISVEDRGFTFADGVYEVVKCFGGRPFLLDRHLQRLRRSAAELEIPLPDLDNLAQVMLELSRRNQVPEGGIYLQVTRGAAFRQHTFPDPLIPTVVVLARRMHFATDAHRTDGVSVITLPDERWGRCDIKTVGLLPNVLARERARRGGAFEAVLIRDGVVTEASAHNFFAVIDGALQTHPATPRILPGITRGRLLELARELAVPVREEALPAERLAEVEEAFVTGTGDLVVPVVRIDERTVGEGRPGPLTCLLRDAMLALTE